jgi:hypothetical protein
MSETMLDRDALASARSCEVALGEQLVVVVHPGSAHDLPATPQDLVDSRRVKSSPAPLAPLGTIRHGDLRRNGLRTTGGEDAEVAQGVEPGRWHESDQAAK